MAALTEVARKAAGHGVSTTKVHSPQPLQLLERSLLHGREKALTGAVNYAIDVRVALTDVRHLGLDILRRKVNPHVSRAFCTAGRGRPACEQKASSFSGHLLSQRLSDSSGGSQYEPTLIMPDHDAPP